MDRQLYNALRALCLMWRQYCDGPSGHMFMTAGEDTEEVLDEHGLLTPTGEGIGANVNWDRLQELYNSIIDPTVEPPSIDKQNDKYEF